MQITKYIHACVVLNHNNQAVVIDPGVWSTDFVIPDQPVVAIVVTHEHPDHFDRAQLEKIVAQYPEAIIYAPAGVTAQLTDLPHKSVTAGDEVTAGDFTLRITGGKHATIHPDYPVCENIGVIVNNGAFYYPGDSFVLPGCPIKILAVPASAPWMKMSEAMDFITAVKPETCFPTHNALVSTEGQQFADVWLGKATEKVDSAYETLPG